MRKGITLIGMPEAGKTTLGPVLGTKLGWEVIDVDSLIVEREGELIGQILENNGQEYLLDLETKCAAELILNEKILVTPGSIVYDTACHDQLRQQTIIVWLDVSLATLLTRVGSNPEKAGALVKAQDGFESLFNERRPLYAALADIKIDCEGLNPDNIAEEITRRLKRSNAERLKN